MNSPSDQNSCLNTSVSFPASAASASQPSNLAESKQPNSLKSTQTLKQSCDRTSPKSLSTPTSETTTQSPESLILYQQGFPVQALRSQEAEQDYNTEPQDYGEKLQDVSSPADLHSLSSSNLMALSDEDFEQFWDSSSWQDTLAKLKLSRQRSLELVTEGNDCSLFPTLTACNSGSSRPAGQTKCDKWFKDKGLVPSGSQLSPEAMALMMGFPPNWFDCLFPTAQPEDSELDTSQVEPLHQDKQRSPSAESSTSTQLLGGEEKLLEHNQSKCSSPSQKISIPCLVRQPKQPEVKGIIQKDLGDRFSIYLPDSDSTVTVPKLFVYPDFPKSVGQIEKNPRKNSTPSTNNPRKISRKKGQGNGSIYYRTVTKNSKEYTEAYYHYVENGKKRTKYIPKKLLDQVKAAEALKLPVTDILLLLGGDEKNPRKSSSTLSTQVDQKLNDICTDQEVLETSINNPRKTIPPSKKRRKQGAGAGYIECKPIKRSGKEYKQYWYHWEVWFGGDRLIKKSRYIPKRLVNKVEKMEADKVPVRKILAVLGVKE